MIIPPLFRNKKRPFSATLEIPRCFVIYTPSPRAVTVNYQSRLGPMQCYRDFGLSWYPDIDVRFLLSCDTSIPSPPCSLPPHPQSNWLNYRRTKRRRQRRDNLVYGKQTLYCFMTSSNRFCSSPTGYRRIGRISSNKYGNKFHVEFASQWDASDKPNENEEEGGGGGKQAWLTTTGMTNPESVHDDPNIPVQRKATFARIA